jgi:hypothetical protein
VADVEIVSTDELHPHPRNYRAHPEEQLEHLKQSIREHGVYRSVVVANDLTILAGHGVYQAACELGIEQLPVTRLPYGPDDPKAIKVLVADNEVAHLADVDDRLLSELLEGLIETDDLLGTGFDEMMLSALQFVTGVGGEHSNEDQWRGLPDVPAEEDRISLIVHFDSEKERETFCQTLDLKSIRQLSGRPSTWWPPREKRDWSPVVFDNDA